MDLPNTKVTGAGAPDAESKRYRAFADQVFAPLYPYLYADLCRVWGESVAGCRILEIGPGAGHMALLLAAAKPASLTLVDRHHSMLVTTQARVEGDGLQKNGNTTYVCADVGCLPLSDGRFDIVYSRGSVMFWNNLAEAFAELARVTRPDGLIFVGAGYGLSTPDDVVALVKTRRDGHDRGEGRSKKSIPRVEPAELLAGARAVGGEARLHTKAGGFWLEWRPLQRLTRSG